MTTREWKEDALGYLIWHGRFCDSKYRREREYASYLKRFFFGDGEVSFSGDNDVWQMRKERKELPMPYNIYFGG